ncbi:MAG: rRNA maturation RNase YbeY [Lentisphaerae bacterium]|jgi:probable rRNA maturation factor|nr:rRNA maturation RNase YbeY [Lentisphaerota bacterium]
MIPSVIKCRGGLKLHRRTTFVKAVNYAAEITGLQKDPGILQIILLDQGNMAELNQAHLNHAGPTDVLTFDLRNENSAFGDIQDQDEFVAAEIYVCPEVAARYAKEHGLDPSTELLLYVVHGMLHLMGFDDHSEQDAAKMRQAEARTMEKIKARFNTTGFIKP